MRRPLFSLYQRLSARLTVSGARRLCAVSLDHYRSSLLRKSLPDRPAFAVELPNGVDADTFSQCGAAADLNALYGIPAAARVVLFIAALDRAHHFKGLDRLLQAFGHLPAEIWLLVVGDGDRRSYYEAEVRRQGLANRTVFARSVEHEATPLYFRAADATVLPSSPPESFGLVLIESMACGTPVVASNIPGVRAVVDHGVNGLLVDSADAVALASAIQQVLDDDGLRRSMARFGRAKVESRYSWEKIGDRLEDIYLAMTRQPSLETDLCARC